MAKRITLSDETYESLYNLLIRLLKDSKTPSADKEICDQVLRSYANLNTLSTTQKSNSGSNQNKVRDAQQNGVRDAQQNGVRDAQNGQTGSSQGRTQPIQNGQQQAQYPQQNGQSNQPNRQGYNGQQNR